MDYTDVIEELRNKGITAAKGDYYDYKAFPLEDEFDSFFKFAQEYLETGNLPKEVRPARLFYNTNTDNNAGAWCYNGYSLIEIFKGSLFWMHNYFTEKDELFSQDKLKHFKELTERKEVSPGKFMYQMLTIFYLYHETGHLIQRREDKKEYIEFIDSQLSEDDVSIRHANEHDADWFASTCLATHVKQFCEEETEKAIALDLEQLKQLAPLALASIYMYFINRIKNTPKLYYKQNSHPHPTVRLCYMVIYFLDNLFDDANEENQRETLRKALDISEFLMQDDEPKNIVMEYSKAMYDELNEIEAYIKEIRSNSEADKNSCINYFTK